MKRTAAEIAKLLAAARPETEAERIALDIMKDQFGRWEFISDAHEERLEKMAGRGR